MPEWAESVKGDLEELQPSKEATGDHVDFSKMELDRCLCKMNPTHLF